MQIDEAGSHDEPRRVDHALGAAEPRADGGNLSIHHRHIANGVHPACRVHHPAATDHYAAHLVTP
jgi:hypothetical protein